MERGAGRAGGRRTGAALLGATVAAAVASAGPACAPVGEGWDPGAERQALGEGDYGQVAGLFGGMRMYLYAPPSLPPSPAVVVVLHGCGQTAADMRHAGWEWVADTYGFYVVYADNGGGCMEWWGTSLTRGQGANQAVVDMLDAMAPAGHPFDERRVFVTGLSAGAALTTIMLATWPDRFAGGGPTAGIPHGCGADYGRIGTCMGGVDLTPSAWGDLVRSAYPGYTGPWPRVSVWHGTADGMVSFRNAGEIAEQWTDVHGAAATPAEDQLEGFPHRVWRDGTGRPVVELVEVTGGSHASFVDPAIGCGDSAGMFFDPKACAAL